MSREQQARTAWQRKMHVLEILKRKYRPSYLRRLGDLHTVARVVATRHMASRYLADFFHLIFVTIFSKFLSIIIIIIIISPLQSIAGHRPHQFLAISLNLRLFASSSCQPFTWFRIRSRRETPSIALSIAR
jgi:hypothetical protein